MNIRTALRRALNTLVESDKPDDYLVPVPCDCRKKDGSPISHGPHWVPLRAIRKGGYLHGKVDIDRVALEIAEAEEV